MVEINNQRKAFLDMLAWSEGTDNGRQENQKSWLWRHCRRRAIYWLLRSPSQTGCHNFKFNCMDATSFFPAGGMPYCKQLGLKDFSPKSQDAVALQQIKEVALYLWLPVVISVRQSTVAATFSFHRRALVAGCLHKADSLIVAPKKRAERSERLMYEQSHRDYLRSGAIRIIVCLSWAVNYRDNAITYKAQRDKNARELKLANAAHWYRCVSVMLLRSMQNTRRS